MQEVEKKKKTRRNEEIPKIEELVQKKRSRKAEPEVVELEKKKKRSGGTKKMKEEATLKEDKADFINGEFMSNAKLYKTFTTFDELSDTLQKLPLSVKLTETGLEKKIKEQLQRKENNEYNIRAYYIKQSIEGKKSSSSMKVYLEFKDGVQEDVIFDLK